ncbi:MAG: hypothetical protein ACLQPH_05950 [Acidimicrobiales bacterium]
MSTTIPSRMTHVGSPDPQEEASAMNPNVTTVIGDVSTVPFTINERSGRRRRAGFQVAVHRRYWVKRLDRYEEATTTFDVRCSGYAAENALAKLNLGARVVVCGHFEHGACGMLELHADVVALAFSDEPRVDSESAAEAA